MSDKTICFSGTFQEFYEQAYENGFIQGYMGAIEFLINVQKDAEDMIPTEDLLEVDQFERMGFDDAIFSLKMFEKELKQRIKDGKLKNTIPSVGLINLLPPEEKTTDN